MNGAGGGRKGGARGNKKRAERDRESFASAHGGIPGSATAAPSPLMHFFCRTNICRPLFCTLLLLHPNLIPSFAAATLKKQRPKCISDAFTSPMSIYKPHTTRNTNCNSNVIVAMGILTCSHSRSS